MGRSLPKRRRRNPPPRKRRPKPRSDFPRANDICLAQRQTKSTTIEKPGSDAGLFDLQTRVLIVPRAPIVRASCRSCLSALLRYRPGHHGPKPPFGRSRFQQQPAQTAGAGGARLRIVTPASVPENFSPGLLTIIPRYIIRVYPAPNTEGCLYSIFRCGAGSGGRGGVSEMRHHQPPGGPSRFVPARLPRATGPHDGEVRDRS